MFKKDKVIDAKFKELDEDGNPIEKPEEEEKKDGEFGEKMKAGAKRFGKWALKGLLYGLGSVAATAITLKLTGTKTHWVDIPLNKDTPIQDVDVSEVVNKFDEAFEAAKDAGMEVKEF